MDHRDFPDIPHDLMTHLSKTFPERSADLGMSMETVMFEAGKRAVIRTLLAVYAEQNRTILSPEEVLNVQA